MRSTLLYDGDCRFCCFAARCVLRLDRSRTLAILPFDDPRAAPHLAPIPEAERFASWHLLFPDGRKASRGRGAVELLATLPSTRRLAPLLRPLPLERIYNFIASHRSRLGRYVPNGPAPRA